ncbi:MAG TPA: hypothetical protein VMV41_06215 [Cellulomonadaceae bacterium]|nr:hypothetical protein [Cellulomonadaceae bacterium]
MPNDERESPMGPDGPTGTNGRPWFRPNRSGVGWHPSSWQGWLVLGVVVAALVVIVVLRRTGVL